jgi:hypothetical protein
MTGIEFITIAFGILILGTKFLIALAVIGFATWALFKFAGFIFSLLFYGMMTVVTIFCLIGGGIWLLA